MAIVTNASNAEIEKVKGAVPTLPCTPYSRDNNY